MRMSVAIMLSAWSSLVLAADLPARKPGLWEMQVTSVSQKKTAPPITQCIDAKTDVELQKRSLQPAGGGKVDCSKNALTRTADGWVSDTVCKIAQTTTTTHAVMKGDPDSAYTIESRTSFDPPLNGTKESAHSVSVRWLGPCPADMKPGDMRVNGRTFNVLELPRQSERLTPEQRRALIERMQKQPPAQ